MKVILDGFFGNCVGELRKTVVYGPENGYNLSYPRHFRVKKLRNSKKP